MNTSITNEYFNHFTLKSAGGNWYLAKGQNS